MKPTAPQPKTQPDAIDTLALHLWSTSGRDGDAEVLHGERPIYPHGRVKWMSAEIRQFIETNYQPKR